MVFNYSNKKILRRETKKTTRFFGDLPIINKDQDTIEYLKFLSSFDNKKRCITQDEEATELAEPYYGPGFSGYRWRELTLYESIKYLKKTWKSPNPLF